MRAALKPGAHCLLELYQLPEERRALLAHSGNRLKTWQALAAEDPFAYYLDDFQFWPEKQTLRHEKIFIRRDGRIDSGRYEVLAYQTREELERLLAQHGFSAGPTSADFAGEPYVEGKSAALVVLARAV